MTDRLEGRSDAELLELSVAGEESAFLLLYERLKTSIFRYAFYMTNSKTAAEEVTQEVFISLLKDGERYRKARGDVAAFAFGIARNFVRRLQKRERVYQGLPTDEVLEKISASQAGTEGLSAQVIRNQGIERIRTAIASLPVMLHPLFHAYPGTLGGAFVFGHMVSAAHGITHDSSQCFRCYGRFIGFCFRTRHLHLSRHQQRGQCKKRENVYN
jgi:RNA polymerase sigma factor (sigma-70 family)